MLHRHQGATRNEAVAAANWLPHIDSLGERGGTRTHDPLIKSQMLYRLSYALAFRRPVPTAWAPGGQ
jgi:hypothetical protein